MDPNPNPASEERPASEAPVAHRRILVIVIGLLLPAFMASLDGTIVATALPTIGRQLGHSTNLSWIVTIYLLTSTASAPLFGKISDIRGRRPTMLAAQLLFLAGSIGCALSTSVPLLILARAVQGAGSGGLITQAMTILGDVAAPKERARYYTYFSIVYTAAGAIGPALGGFLAERVDWSAIFWLNAPVGVAGLYLTGRSLRGLPKRHRPHRLDVAGAVLIVAASASAMFALDSGGAEIPWLSFEMGGLALVSAWLWVAFALHLSRVSEPLIPLRVLRDPIVRMASASNAFGWGAMVAMNVYLPIYLQTVVGLPAVAAGLSMMIVMAAMNVSALAGAQLAARVTRYKVFPMSGLALACAASLLLAFRAEDLGLAGFEIVIALIGLGFGPAAPVTSVALQNAVNLSELGTSIAAMTFARNLFTTMLLAGFGAIVFRAHPGEPPEPSAAVAAAAALAKESGFRLVFGLAAASFFASFIAMAAMEEKPLAPTNEGRSA